MSERNAKTDRITVKVNRRMVNERFMLGMTALAVVLGITVLGSCASSPYIVLEEPLKPDSKSALVIFLGTSSTKAQLWDGEKPVGTFKGTPSTSMNCIFWKATPGAHIFVGRSSNFVHQRMNLQANRTYYIRIHVVPAPYTTPITMKEATKQDYDDFIAPWRKVRNLEFDDKWRKEFLAENDGQWLKDIREYLKTAK